MPKQSLIAASVAQAVSGVCCIPTTAQADAVTTSPIKHRVVIFQENVSFDHYWATKTATP
jgi:phospholipase C